MGYHDSAECNAAQDRAWGQDAPSITQIAQAAESVRKGLTAPFSEQFDAFCDSVEDECSELREVVLMLLKGEGPEAVARMNVIATQYAYRTVQEGL